MHARLDPGTEVFEPIRSNGWLWLLATAALVFAGPVVLYLAPEEEPVPQLLWIVMALLAVLGVWMLIVVASIPSMRYELTADALEISCGPLLRYRVPYDAILGVEKRDLSPTIWSSWRFPGLALYNVPYKEGRHLMCANSMGKGMTVIDAGEKRYGITPAEDDRFAVTLAARTRPR